MHIKYNDAGLVPAIAQDFVTGRVLMLAWMNEESLKLTLETGYVTYYSRTRERLWRKGESSGHTQRVREVLLDCDGDTILLRVDQEGPACHTGEQTCFFNRLDEPAMERREATKHLPAGEYRPAGSDVIADVMDVVRDRLENPKSGSYTNFLFDAGTDKICKKIGEESAEVIIAAKNATKRELSGEIADLIYHLMVLMADQGVGWRDVYDELASRR